MKAEQIKNQEGEVMTTKTGKTLMKYTLEAGDEFIPCYNNVQEKKNEVEIKGKKTTITNYFIKAIVRSKDTEEVYKDTEGEEELYISLTEAQANTLKKKVNEGKELNQLLFVVYEYESKDYGTQIGVGEKSNMKPRKNFSDFKKTEQKE